MKKILNFKWLKEAKKNKFRLLSRATELLDEKIATIWIKAVKRDFKFKTASCRGRRKAERESSSGADSLMKQDSEFHGLSFMLTRVRKHASK